jgi:hypothetical protein
MVKEPPGTMSMSGGAGAIAGALDAAGGGGAATGATLATEEGVDAAAVGAMSPRLHASSDVHASKGTNRTVTTGE